MALLDAPPAVRRPVVTLRLLRAVLTAHLLVVLAQPLLAGRYLAGDVDAIEVHGLVGDLLPAVVLLVAVAAVAHVVATRSRWWLLPVAGLLFLAEGLQVGMGHARVLAVHVPLGVAVVVAAVVLAGWVWTPGAARARTAAR
jgi:hypothetical protein